MSSLAFLCNHLQYVALLLPTSVAFRTGKEANPGLYMEVNRRHVDCHSHCHSEMSFSPHLMQFLKQMLLTWNSHQVSVTTHPIHTWKKMNLHSSTQSINSEVKSSFLHPSLQLAKIKPILSKDDLKTVIDAYTPTWLDYCNSYLDISQSPFPRLKLVKNAATQLLTATQRREHITAISSIHFTGCLFKCICFKSTSSYMT